jgi:hypothetical protein
MLRHLLPIIGLYLIITNLVFATTSPEPEHAESGDRPSWSEEALAEIKKSIKAGEDFLKKKDYQNAINTMQIAAEMGYPDAMFILYELYLMESEYQDYKSAYHWAMLYMLHTKYSKHLGSVLPWLSLAEMEQVHKKMLSWLEYKSLDEKMLIRIRRFLGEFLSNLEQVNLATSRVISVPKDIVIYIPLYMYK